MNCKDAREMTVAYLDNNLDPMRDILIVEHLQSCPECRAELDFIIKYRGMLKTVKPVSPPDNFLSEIRRKIELERDKNLVNRLNVKIQYLRENFRFPVEAAGVLAAAILIFFLYKPFFNEKTNQTFPESGIKPASDEMPAEKTITTTGEKYKNRELTKPATRESKDISVKSIFKKNIPKQRNEEVNLSIKNDSAAGSVSTDDRKKAMSVESEKSIMDEDKKFYSPGSPVTKEVRKAKKDTPGLSVSNAEKILWESDVSIVRKDLSDGERLFYKIKVDPSKYNTLINRLNRDFSVEEKFIKKSKSSYHVELFLEKK